jgi:hypothetical protein
VRNCDGSTVEREKGPTGCGRRCPPQSYSRAKKIVSTGTRPTRTMILPKPRGEPFDRIGGGGGIRTHGTLSRTTVFKTVAIDHSATPPQGLLVRRRSAPGGGFGQASVMWRSLRLRRQEWISFRRNGHGTDRGRPPIPRRFFRQHRQTLHGAAGRFDRPAPDCGRPAPDNR